MIKKDPLSRPNVKNFKNKWYPIVDRFRTKYYDIIDYFKYVSSSFLHSIFILL